MLREQRPDLAIIDRPIWDAVQVRLDEHAKNYKVRAVPHQKTAYLLTGLLKCGSCGGLMQIRGGSPHRYYRCVSNRKRGVCGNRLSVRETLARERILEAIHRAVASPDAAAYVRHRLAERMGALSRESGAELTERFGRLKRVEERVRSIILMQVDGDRSPMVAQMRADLEAQAQAERVAVSDLQAQADAPIRLPPVELITERVLALKALTESADVDGARATLRRYLKDGQITLTPEPFGDAQAYTARAEFLPLIMLTDKAETPSQIALGGSCPRLVARGRYSLWTTNFWLPFEKRVA